MDQIKKHFRNSKINFSKEEIFDFLLGAIYPYLLELLWSFKIRVKAQGGVLTVVRISLLLGCNLPKLISCIFMLISCLLFMLNLQLNLTFILPFKLTFTVQSTSCFWAKCFFKTNLFIFELFLDSA